MKAGAKAPLIPLFLVGFAALVALNSLGVLPKVAGYGLDAACHPTLPIVAVPCAQAIHERGAEHVLPQPLLRATLAVGADKQQELPDFRSRPQQLLDQHSPQEASGPSDKDALVAERLSDSE